MPLTRFGLQIGEVSLFSPADNYPDGGEYYTGWITPDTGDWGEAGIWCWVWGANSSYPPYIKITTP